MPLTLTLSGETMDDLISQVADMHARFTSDDSDDGDAAEAAPKAARKPRGKAAATKADPEPEKAAEPSITLAALKEKFGRLIAMGEAGSKASVEIIAGLGAVNEQGLPKVDALKAEQYDQCSALVDAKIEELTPKGVL